jgi:tRNA(Leu) C34 or U34 (ribose-2'-O)-methylase TrmL
MIEVEPITFEWNDNHSRSENFDTWLRRTNREHRNYKEIEYTKEEGLKIFDKLYPVGALYPA